jgi:lysyl-tRNA synthetase class 2
MAQAIGAKIETLILRARLLAGVREFFQRADYLEVETPLRVPAPAPEAHIDPLASESWYLQTSPELCMKRLLAAGYSRIYQICKCFRRAERGSRHLPEFTMLEWYTAGDDYQALMDQTEALLRFAAQWAGLGDGVQYQGRRLNLGQAPWPRMTVAEAFARWSPQPLAEALAQDRFDETVTLEIEPHLGVPTPLFLFDYPLTCGALARRKPSDGELAERFELYWAGVELCNGFSELVDAGEQRRRFERELAHRRRRNAEIWPLPERFLEDLTRMPAAAGNALGLDRLMMIWADASTIDEVVVFTPETL